MRNTRKCKCFYVLMILILVLVWGIFPGYARNENLVSNVDGKIRVILLHYGNGAYLDGFWFDMTVLYRDLFEKMDADVGFVVLVGKDVKADEVREKLKPYTTVKLADGTARVKFLEVNVKTGDFYPWARDGYFVQVAGDGNLVFLDAGFNQSPFPICNFDEVFDGACTRTGIIHRGGGNARTTDQEVFIGMDTILGINASPRWNFFRNADETVYSVMRDWDKDDLPSLKERFEAHARMIHYITAPDKKLVIPGKERFFSMVEKGEFKFDKKRVHTTGAQAAYHTDVYLSLGPIDENGNRILFIADSKLGASIVEKMSPAERRAVERALPAVLESEGLTAAGIPVTKEQIARRFQWEQHKLLDLGLQRVPSTSTVLDQTAAYLESQGYHIMRVPYLPNGLDNTDNRNDRVYGISFNYSNVLTEVYGTVKKVYLPRFGFKQMDEAAAHAYEQAGYRVIFIKGLLNNSVTDTNDGAGLDCLTSDIRVPVRWNPKFYPPQK